MTYLWFPFSFERLRLLGNVGPFIRFPGGHRSPRFSALQTALPADFEIFFFTCDDCFSGFTAKVAWVLATCLSAQRRDVCTAVVGVFCVEHYSVGAHEQTEFSSQDASFDEFKSAQNVFPHLLAA